MDREIPLEKLPMETLAHALGTTPEQIVSLGFNDELRWILLTETSGQKVLFRDVDVVSYMKILHGLPEEFTPGGFIHTEEKITFTAFVVISNKPKGPETLLDALWQV